MKLEKMEALFKEADVMFCVECDSQGEYRELTNGEDAPNRVVYAYKSRWLGMWKLSDEGKQALAENGVQI